MSDNRNDTRHSHPASENQSQNPKLDPVAQNAASTKANKAVQQQQPENLSEVDQHPASGQNDDQTNINHSTNAARSQQQSDAVPIPIATDADSADPALQAQENVSAVAPQVVELTEKLTAAEDRALRALAELENTRRRHEKEKQEISKYGAAKLIKEVLLIADNLERAVNTAKPEQPITPEMWDGVVITLREVHKLLKNQGIERISPQLGEEVNYNQHQAVGQLPTSNHSEGTIAAVLQDGYLLHGRLLRPASVMVASQGPAEKKPQAATDTKADNLQQPAASKNTDPHRPINQKV